MIHDVIVVGSGPGGAIAASVLRRRGRSVLLVDRSSFPRDKTCGDGMPATTLKRLKDMDIPFQPTSFEHQRIEGIYLESYTRRSIVVPEVPSSTYSMVAPRFGFDNFLHQHALACGVQFEVMDVVEPLLSNGQVVGVVERRGGQKLEHEAKVVIAADGASSVIARGLKGRVSSPEETALAIRAYGEWRGKLPIPPLVRFYYQRHLAPGYAWIFPVGDGRVNVGLGLFDQSVYKAGSKSLKEMLAEFLDQMSGEFPIDLIPETVKSWPIPVWISAESRVSHGAYFIGDAGRFADALTGGGIFPAIVTGQLAAAAIERQFQGATAQEATHFYDEAWRSGIGRSLKRMLIVRNTLLAQPFLFNTTMLAATTFPFMKKALLSNLAGQHA